VKQPSSISVLFGAGVAGFCWWTYSGPYRWLAEWQLSTFGHYYRFYTFVLLAIGISAGITQVVRAVRQFTGAGEENAMPAWWRELESHPPRFYQMLAGGVVLLVLGACSAWSSASSERAGLCRIPLSLLESGEKRTSDWVQITGTLLWEDCWVWEDGALETWYVPIVSADWRPGDPATAFARFTTAEAEAAGEIETVKGMVEQTGMPGPIEAGFEEDGPPPADGAFVVNANETPSSNRLLHFALMLLGLGMTVGSLFVYESQPEFVDAAVALDPVEPDEAAKPQPANTRRGAATTLMDWSPPDAESDCDAEVQAWLKAHNMERS
jgi:hypothetical protein